MNLINQTSAINRTFYYGINVTDLEDGNQNSGNFTFNITFLSGTDFINNNETIFNTTSGILNITFNSTQGGRYHLNVTVTDSAGKKDSGEFWIFVYDIPEVIFPSQGYNFTAQENTASNLTFIVNHSVGDNLTFIFKIDNIIYNLSSSNNFTYGDFSVKWNESYYGNASNFTWQFTPNFTDETYGLYKNLTLIVYPIKRLIGISILHIVTPLLIFQDISEINRRLMIKTLQLISPHISQILTI